MVTETVRCGAVVSALGGRLALMGLLNSHGESGEEEPKEEHGTQPQREERCAPLKPLPEFLKLPLHAPRFH